MGVRTTGCHRMAFVTNNVDGTVEFYNGLLGFPVVVTLQLPNPDPFPGVVPGNLGGSRHYCFRISEQETIAFFELGAVCPQIVADATATRLAGRPDLAGYADAESLHMPLKAALR